MSAALAQSGADAASTPGTEHARQTHRGHMPQTSALYCGHIGHARFGAIAHRFRYRLFMTALNLDELARPDGLGLWHWLNPTRRLSLFRMRRKDHLGDAHTQLKDSVLQRVGDALIGFEPGPVVLLTHLGQFGFRFNPVSLYFCFAPSAPPHSSAAGEPTADAPTAAAPTAVAQALQPRAGALSAIVLEVSNTPWGEQHSYVLDCRNSAGPHKFVLPKTFTVSPFLPLDMEYRFRFDLHREQITIHKENWRGGERHFHAALQLQRSALTNASLLGALLRYPLMTWKVITTIYYQALRLWLKGVPFLGHGNARATPRQPSSSPSGIGALQVKPMPDKARPDTAPADTAGRDKTRLNKPTENSADE